MLNVLKNQTQCSTLWCQYCNRYQYIKKIQPIQFVVVVVSSTVGPTLTNIQNICTSEKNIYVVHRMARVGRVSLTNIQYLMYEAHCTMQRMVNYGRPGLTNIHGRWQTNIQDHLLQGVALDTNTHCIHTILRRSYRQIHDVLYTNTPIHNTYNIQYTSFEDEWHFHKS